MVGKRKVKWRFLVAIVACAIVLTVSGALVYAEIADNAGVSGTFTGFEEGDTITAIVLKDADGNTKEVELNKEAGTWSATIEKDTAYTVSATAQNTDEKMVVYYCGTAVNVSEDTADIALTFEKVVMPISGAIIQSGKRAKETVYMESIEFEEGTYTDPTSGLTLYENAFIMDDIYYSDNKYGFKKASGQSEILSFEAETTGIYECMINMYFCEEDTIGVKVTDSESNIVYDGEVTASSDWPNMDKYMSRTIEVKARKGETITVYDKTPENEFYVCGITVNYRGIFRNVSPAGESEQCVALGLDSYFVTADNLADWEIGMDYSLDSQGSEKREMPPIQNVFESTFEYTHDGEKIVMPDDCDYMAIVKITDIPLHGKFYGWPYYIDEHGEKIYDDSILFDNVYGGA